MEVYHEEQKKPEEQRKSRKATYQARGTSANVEKTEAGTLKPILDDADQENIDTVTTMNLMVEVRRFIRSYLIVTNNLAV